MEGIKNKKSVEPKYDFLSHPQTFTSVLSHEWFLNYIINFHILYKILLLVLKGFDGREFNSLVPF